MLIGHNDAPVYAFALALNTFTAYEEEVWYDLTELSPCCGAVRGMGRNTVPTNPFRSKFEVADLDACCDLAYAMPAYGMYAPHDVLLCLTTNTSPGGADLLTKGLETRFAYYVNPLKASLAALSLRDQFSIIARSLQHPDRRRRKVLWEEL